MIPSRKGALYLFLAAILVTIFGSLYFITEGFQTGHDQATITVRAQTVDDFITDFHQDLNRASYISGFRALLGMEEYLSEQGIFFDDQAATQEAFRQLFTNGTYNNVTLNILDDASFTDYTTRVQQQADTIGITLNATISNVTITQATPWHLHITFTGEFFIEDKELRMWWNYTENFTTTLPIYNLKDPLYAVNTYGRVPNTIRNYTLPPAGFVDGNDTTIIKAFLKDSYYRASDEAPSYLQRFTGDLSPSTNGIESLVYLPALSDQDLVVKTDRSVVDHIYFSTNPNSTNDHCHIQNMVFTPDWFRIDDDHMDDYELDSLSSTGC